jgi:hypothetical protein
VVFCGVMPATTQTGWLSTPLQIVSAYTPEAPWSSAGPESARLCYLAPMPESYTSLRQIVG